MSIPPSPTRTHQLWKPLLWIVLPSLSLMVVSTAHLGAGEISYFRRDGGVVGDERPLPNNLEEDAKLQWRTELLPGNSTPCVCGDRLFLTTWDSVHKQLHTVCLRRQDGTVAWTKQAPTREIEPFHPVSTPAASTAACDGKQVYVFFGSCGLLCYDMDGELVWHKPMGPFQDEFGAASSPILLEDRIILNQDHDIGSVLMAISKQTGETLWATPRDTTRSYSSPLIWEHDGKREIVVAGSLQLAGYDPATGHRHWWVNGLSRIVDNTPSVVGNRIYVATWTPGADPSDRIRMEPFPEILASVDKNGDGTIARDELPAGSPVLERFFRIDINQNSQLEAAEWDRYRIVFELAQNVAMAVSPSGEGDVTATSVKWVVRRGLPTVPSSVVYQGVMYMVKDGGILSALDAESGELLQQERIPGRGNYYASLLAGDGKVFACSESGELSILKASRPFEKISSHEFKERVVATPVVEDGQLFIRTDAAMYCYTKAESR